MISSNAALLFAGFGRAFVRSYAIEVGLDPEATIQDFIAHFPNDSVIAGHPTSDQVEDHEAVESERRTAGTFLWLLVILFSLMLYVVLDGYDLGVGVLLLFERDDTRSKEMMEARVDAVFASLMSDPKFISLTSGADGRLPSGAGQQ